ncbi:MAG: type II/IV secretion system protein [Candidatus Pacebacteria bacterium]|nr:type II/IV secretion system protein [Candidatus Paceibacterota bacterium]
MSLLKKLIEKGILDKEKSDSLEKGIKSSNRREEEVILESGLIPEIELFSIKSESLKIPLKEVVIEKVPLQTLELIPEETAKYYQMIPIQKTEKDLEVGMVYPEDLKAQEALKFLARQGNFNYRIFLITDKTFKDLLKQYSNLKKEVGIALEELETELKEEKGKKKPLTRVEFQRMTEEAPITKIVAVILRHAVEGNASDIHIEPAKDKLRIRFRLLGILYSSIFLPLNISQAVIARIKILSNLKIDETRIPQDGRFSTKINTKSIDFRVSTFPTTMGEKAAIRVLDPETGLKSFEALGLESRNLEVVQEGISKPYGLILATGPTGCGKTTTLYAILQLLNKEGVNIVTLEDPVEYFIEGINQSQVRPEIGYSFASGLRQILRQDPDIIMVGEIRDKETASLVIHAALTGHIVLSTLHTSNALGVIPRLVDMGIEPYLIPSTLQLAMAQRLIRRLCDDCKEEIKPNPKIRDIILKEIEELPLKVKNSLKIEKTFSLFKSKGCPKCNGAGFTGRIGIFEILSATPSLSDIILKEPSEHMIKKEADEQSMVTMKQDGILKALRGITTIEEVLRVAEEK